MQALDSKELLPLPKRAPAAHKGDFGHLLVVGGDLGMGGAVLISGVFAARSGAGKVSIATCIEHAPIILSYCPELMPHGIEAGASLAALFSRVTAVSIGPGLGHSLWSEALATQTFAQDLPQVIDADALTYLKSSGQKVTQAVLTPHAGEAARLLDTDLDTIQQDRAEAVQKLQQRYGGVVVLKGRHTLIYQGKELWYCPYGNPGMASGGMGDALTGIIGALLAQGYDAMTAAKIGVVLHARAGDLTVEKQGEYGLLATDLIPALLHLLNQTIA